MIANNYFDGSTADYETISIDPGTSSYRIVGPERLKDVIGFGKPVVSAAYCKSGITTGETCGFVAATTSAVVTLCNNPPDCTSTTTLYDQVIANRIACCGVAAGDSGGSVYQYADTTKTIAVAFGVESGGNDSGTSMTFSKIANVLSLFSAHLTKTSDAG